MRKKPDMGDWFFENFEELRVEDIERELREHADFYSLEIDYYFETFDDYIDDYWEYMDVDGDDEDVYE